MTQPCSQTVSKMRSTLRHGHPSFSSFGSHPVPLDGSGETGHINLQFKPEQAQLLFHPINNQTDIDKAIICHRDINISMAAFCLGHYSCCDVFSFNQLHSDFCWLRAVKEESGAKAEGMLGVLEPDWEPLDSHIQGVSLIPVCCCL